MPKPVALRAFRPLCLLPLLAALAAPVAAQVPAEVEIQPVAGKVHVLTGRGGNIGLLVGEDGAFLIDDQFAPVTPKILERVKEVSEQPVRFVVNTHWHGDHTGGNENLAEVGAVIVAHENVRKRLSTRQFMEAFQREVPPSPDAALPVITFTDAITFHWNDETVDIFHIAHAHTDGDSIIHFREANVVHMGDTFFHGQYPFIDASSGGHVDGVIEAADRVLELTDSDSRIIPGHGPLASRTDLQSYRDMLVTIRDAVRDLTAEGKTVDEIIAAAPTAPYDETQNDGFIKNEALIRTIHAGFGQRGGKPADAPEEQ